jgi:hypothetical protein
VKGQLQDPERLRISDLGVGDRSLEATQALAAGPDHELTDAAAGIAVAIRVLERETLIVVVVPDDDDIRADLVEQVPERTYSLRVAVLTGAEERVVPVGDRAECVARRQVGREPLALRIGLVATADLIAQAVEDHDVPVAQLVAVVALARLTSSGAEVGEVGARARGVVVMVAGRGTCPRLICSPSRVVAVRELLTSPVGVGVVAGGEHGSGNAIDEVRGLLVASTRGANGDVACSDEHRIVSGEIRDRTVRSGLSDLARQGVVRCAEHTDHERAHRAAHDQYAEPAQDRSLSCHGPTLR